MRSATLIISLTDGTIGRIETGSVPWGTDAWGRDYGYHNER